MSSPANEFERQLGLFRSESESALQFFYAWQSVHAVAAQNEAIARLLNQAPLFWNTNLGALQTSAFVALGRIFDPDPKNHSVTRLVAFALANVDIFSKNALAERKRKLSANADEWLPEFLRGVYVPETSDFRRLKRHVAIRRKIYEERYRPLRHRVFAHRGATTRAEAGELFARTNIRELQQLLVFLARLHETLWQLFSNGHKPILRPERYSVQRMLEQASPNVWNAKLQERLIHEAKSFLTSHSKDA